MSTSLDGPSIAEASSYISFDLDMFNLYWLRLKKSLNLEA